MIYKAIDFTPTKIQVNQNITLGFDYLSKNLIKNSYIESIINTKFSMSSLFTYYSDRVAANLIKYNSLLQIPIKDENIRVFVRIYSFVSAYVLADYSRKVKLNTIYKFLKPKYNDSFTHLATGYK